jgi:hypothetical protein
MTKVGDRIAVAARRSAPSRRGTVADVVGTMLVVDWDDGRRSTFYPAPGSVTTLPADDT